MSSNQLTNDDPKPPQTLWLVNLFFGATGAPTGRLLESVAIALIRAGDLPKIITGTLDYSDREDEDTESLSRSVHRIRCGRLQAKSARGRLFSWVRFYFGVVVFVFSHRLPSKIVLMTTPPFLAILFVLRNMIARQKAELILWNQDTYPEILAAVGMLKERQWTYRFLKWVQRLGVARVDKAIVLDKAMQRRIEAYGAKETRVIPNWERVRVETGGGIDDPDLKGLLRDVKATYRYLVIHTGNYGWGHDLTIVEDYLKRHSSNRDFFFLFVGGGEKWGELQSLHDESRIESMAVFPYVSRATLDGLLQEADFGLVALEASCVGLMSPSKIHSYLMAGTPLLYVGPAGSNVDDAIDDFECGFRIEEGDANGFSECLQTILSPEFGHPEMCRRALAAAKERYLENVGVRAILDYLDVKPVEAVRLHEPAAIGANKPDAKT